MSSALRLRQHTVVHNLPLRESVPLLVGVAGQLLPHAPAPVQPLRVVSLPQLQLPLPLLVQHYQLPALQLLQPLAPQLVLHQQLPQAPLLFRPPLQRAVVKSQLKAKSLGAPCVVKSPNSIKAATATLEVKAPPTVKESKGAPEVNKSTAVALASSCQQSEQRCEAIVQQESDLKRETNGAVPEDVTWQAERCENPSAEVKAPSGVANIKVKKMKHVMVLDEDRNFCMELPLKKDNTLALKLLQRHFPGVCGLTYRSTDCPHWQWIILERGKLRAPKGGWEHDLYVCVFSKQSGGKWLHTFCHCSFSTPSKNKPTKSPIKFLSNRNNPVKNCANAVCNKNSQSVEPDVYIVEDSKESERHRCSEIMVCSLPQWVTDDRLREHFGQFGRVVNCVIHKDLVGAHYGLVEFRKFSSREKALAEVFHKFGDAWCSVRPHS